MLLGADTFRRSRPVVCGTPQLRERTFRTHKLLSVVFRPGLVLPGALPDTGEHRENQTLL